MTAPMVPTRPDRGPIGWPARRAPIPRGPGRPRVVHPGLVSPPLGHRETASRTPRVLRSGSATPPPEPGAPA
ncbi:hypothetical protein [Actinosynnema sp. NPDC020468]|uniref:hypothetical protein n=1 Tax=Actinosynnema sp. NPDC020468 TaxID=3154488 RepID=UPI0033E8C9EE